MLWKSRRFVFSGAAIHIAVLLITTCASLPVRAAPRTARNVRICPAGSAPAWVIGPLAMSRECRVAATGSSTPVPNQGVPRARLQFGKLDKDVPPVFVGLSISGGGSRAAVFGMAVMQQLHELGILQHVSAISTTSGGGLAGAYYALYGNNMDWKNAHELMAADYLTPWIKRNLSVSTLGRQLFTDEDRSDVMTDLIDERLF